MSYDANEIAGVFGRAAERYDTVIPFFARFGARLVELAEIQPGESVVDVGAGRGATLFPAAERVGPRGHVLGVDLSEDMVALLSNDVERRGLTNVSVRRMNAEALEVEPESFDVAVSSFVLHLVPAPDVVAGGLRRAVRAGGRVAASAPKPAGAHLEFLLRLFSEFAPRRIRPIPIPFRSDFDLAAVLQRAGFTIGRTVEQEIEFVLADEQAWWDWAWSAGMRGLFEALSPPDREELRQAAFSELAALRTRSGIPLRETATFVIGHRSTRSI